MARYTQAYSSFVQRLVEVEILRRSAAKKERDDPVRLGPEIDALCRGAVVLLCGHLEAYIKELGESAIDSLHRKGVARTDVDARFFYHLSKDIIEEMRDTKDPSITADKVFRLFGRDSALWSRLGPFPDPLSTERFNRGFSNPLFKKVKAYFGRFGYSTYGNDLAAQLRADYQPTTNMVDNLVNTRNKIAHGDANASMPPKDVAEMMSIIRKYCAVTDSAFASWWKTRFCPLR